LMHMLQSGEVPTSPLLADLFPIAADGPLEPWPEDMRDLTDSLVIEKENGTLASSMRSHIWMYAPLLLSWVIT
jgi:hypothetical protein